MKVYVENGMAMSFKTVVPCKEDRKEIASLLIFKEKIKKELTKKKNNDIINYKMKER